MSDNIESTPLQPDQEDSSSRTGIVSLLISLLVIAVIVFGILAALNYMRILPLSSMSPSLFGWLPVSGGGQVENNQNIVDEGKDTIMVSSEASGFSLSIVDEKSIMELLDSMDIFGNNFQDNFGGSTNGVGVKRVNVILTDQEMPEWKYTNEKIGGTYISSKIEVRSGEIIARIYVHPQILSDPEQEKDLGGYIQTGFVTAIYRLTHVIQKPGDGAIVRGGLSDLLTEIGNNQESYFNVSK